MLLKKPLLLVAIAGSLATPVAMADTPAKFGFTAGVGLSAGGDELAKVVFTDGSSQSIKAGQGVDFFVGGHFKPANSQFDINGTAGIKYESTAASNANINLSRKVFELRADYLVNDAVWIGAGPVWHKGIELDTDGFVPNLRYQDAQGITVKLGWKFVALSYTDLEYKDEYGYKYDASNIGISLIGKF